ncbi:MAG: hypothetical protein ABIV28_02705 [Longimicrobiales bacterium]
MQPGGVIAWHRSSNGLILSAGTKIVKDGDNATYIKGEVVIPIR